MSRFSSVGFGLDDQTDNSPVNFNWNAELDQPDPALQTEGKGYRDLVDLGYEQVSIHELPTVLLWTFPILFHRRTDGITIDYWQVGFDHTGDNGLGQLVINRGVIGHKIMELSKGEVELKGGKTAQEQAVQEARYRFNNMVMGKGYRQSLEDSNHETLMLGNTYDDKNMHRFVYPMMAQAKSDGFRCQGFLGSGLVNFVSRTNKTKFANIETLEAEINVFISFLMAILTSLGLKADLDGEMYLHGYSFATVQSVLTTFSRRHEMVDRVVYMVFDLILPDKPLEFRMRILYQAYQRYLAAGFRNTRFHLVGATKVHSLDDLKAFHAVCINNGFEGVMLRHLASAPIELKKKAQQYKLSLYVPRRHNNLLKYKEFLDEEMTVVDVIEGTRKDRGLAIFIVEDKFGVRHTIHPNATDEERAYWFNHKDRCIGRLYKVKFRLRTDKGKLNIPRGLGFVDWK